MYHAFMKLLHFLKFKPIFITVIAVVVIEALIIAHLSNTSSNKSWKEEITLPMYSFSDLFYNGLGVNEAKTPEERNKKMLDWKATEKEMGFALTDIDLVNAEGVWMSEADLANDVNAVEIDCWKEWNTCVIAQGDLVAYTSGVPTLSGAVDYYEITKWDLDEIKAKSGTAFGCFEYELTLDRIHQTVSSVRKKIDNQGLCEGGQGAPLLIYLGDRFGGGTIK